MTVDPRTLPAYAAFRPGGFTPAELIAWHRHFQGHAAHMASADLIEQVVVPLYAVWLKAKPPCPKCGGCGRVFDLLDQIGGAMKPCPDCPESPGVLPFDKWVVTRLLATWEAVHGGVPYDYPMLGRQMLDKLREIGTR